MATVQQLTPSPEARKLYGSMVARADGDILSLEDSLRMGIERHRGGEDPTASSQIIELVSQGWVEPDHEGGGWNIDPKPDKFPPL